MQVGGMSLIVCDRKWIWTAGRPFCCTSHVYFFYISGCRFAIVSPSFPSLEERKVGIHLGFSLNAGSTPFLLASHKFVPFTSYLPGFCCTSHVCLLWIGLHQLAFAYLAQSESTRVFECSLNATIPPFSLPITWSNARLPLCCNFCLTYRLNLEHRCCTFLHSSLSLPPLNPLFYILSLSLTPIPNAGAIIIITQFSTDFRISHTQLFFFYWFRFST